MEKPRSESKKRYMLPHRKGYFNIGNPSPYESQQASFSSSYVLSNSQIRSFGHSS
jgi:hypothetical protein